ncbi:MAG: hypothetical protein CMI01_16055 [Oceanospirillaceae bacterium]|nr:hypothetical protein [Oceanospirillaceae bacterium]
MQAYNQTESKAALEENQSEPAYTFDESNKGAPVTGQIVQQEKADQKIVSQMLEYWYQKADEQTQQRLNPG